MVESNIRGTQDAVQVEFNKHRAAIVDLDKSISEFVANAAEAFDQQKVDLLTSHQTNWKADRLMRDQLYTQYNVMKQADAELRDYLAQKFIDYDREIAKLKTTTSQALPTMASPSTVPVASQPPMGPIQFTAWQNYTGQGTNQGAPSASAGFGHSYPSTPKPLQILGREWNNHKLLDLHLAPEAFDAWRICALGYLAKDRPDIRHILVWAESQSEVIVGGNPQKGVVDPTPQRTTPENFGNANHTLLKPSTGSWLTPFSKGVTFAQAMVQSFGERLLENTRAPQL